MTLRAEADGLASAEAAMETADVFLMWDLPSREN